MTFVFLLLFLLHLKLIFVSLTTVKNASGVLVYDNENVSVLQSMKVEWFRIPSVFTYNWS
jgi:hypothetical protein